MNTQLMPFKFEGRDFRVVTDEQSQPWFNASDVCLALELTNPRKAVADHVDPDDLTKSEVIDALGRTQQANFVNESGMYALIFGSTKEAAKRFKRWVTSEVLPSIRKTGSYTAPNTSEATRITRAMNAFSQSLRLNKAMGMPHAKALVAANEVTIRAHGFDMLTELKANYLVDEAEAQAVALLGKIMQVIERAGREGVTKRELWQSSRAFKSLKPQEMANVLESLISVGEVFAVMRHGARGPSTVAYVSKTWARQLQ
jgi:prophage antirepressor-like protein